MDFLSLEVTIVGDAVAQSIASSACAAAIREAASRGGMRRLLDSAKELVRAGRTTLAEVSRVLGEGLEEERDGQADTGSLTDSTTGTGAAAAGNDPAATEPSELETRLRRRIEENLTEPGFGPYKLAAADLSCHQLYRGLRADVETSPSRFIRTVRGECAASCFAAGPAVSPRWDIQSGSTRPPTSAAPVANDAAFSPGQHLGAEAELGTLEAILPDPEPEPAETDRAAPDPRRAIRRTPEDPRRRLRARMRLRGSVPQLRPPPSAQPPLGQPRGGFR